jgi:hypothetical protein
VKWTTRLTAYFAPVTLRRPSLGVLEACLLLVDKGASPSYLVNRSALCALNAALNNILHESTVVIFCLLDGGRSIQTSTQPHKTPHSLAGAAAESIPYLSSSQVMHLALAPSLPALWRLFTATEPTALYTPYQNDLVWFDDGDFKTVPCPTA